MLCILYTTCPSFVQWLWFIISYKNLYSIRIYLYCRVVYNVSSSLQLDVAYILSYQMAKEKKEKNLVVATTNIKMLSGYKTNLYNYIAIQ